MNNIQTLSNLSHALRSGGALHTLFIIHYTLAVFALALALPAQAQTPQTRPVDRLQTDARGIYLLWAEKTPRANELLAQPCIRGGQVVMQWAEIEPRQGVYDFTALDQKIATLAAKGFYYTVQINGNIKPAWLFSAVPSVPEKFHVQVRDKQGTLMFWHPVHENAHLAMLRAAAAHLKQGKHNKLLLGIRLNFNPVGTEQFLVPNKYRKASAWTYPPSRANRPGEPQNTNGSARGFALPPDYSDAIRHAYEDRVVATYIKEFSPWTLVFVRNNIDGDLLARCAPEFRAGRLALFHTSSEAEPRTGRIQRQYGLFYDYARPGHTVAYAEPWASAWGEHGGKLDDRWCSPCQWNYWTLLLNLHCGVSFIGEYAGNLSFALTANHPRLQSKTVNAKQQSKEFTAAYNWASPYIGRHNRPDEAPGAWVAFRENHQVKATNGVRPENLQLTRFSGDYNYLMERVGTDGSVGVDAKDASKGVAPVGPPDERYGAFARKYPPGTQARLKVDPRFLATLAQQNSAGGVGATLRIIYLDDLSEGSPDNAPATGSAGVPPADGAERRPTQPAGSRRSQSLPRDSHPPLPPTTATVSLHTPSGAKLLGPLPRTATGRWRIAEFTLTPAALAALANAPADWQIAVTAGEKPLTLHMVEIVRKPAQTLDLTRPKST